MAVKSVLVEKYFNLEVMREQLVAYWKKNPVSMQDLAKEIHIEPQALKRFLNGVSPAFENAAKIENFLKSVVVDYKK